MENRINTILFDDTHRDNLLPLTFTRPVSELRIGITTLKEKWELLLNRKCSYHTIDYLSDKYKLILTNDNLFINASIIPEEKLVSRILQLNTNDLLMQQNLILAYRSDSPASISHINNRREFRSAEYPEEIACIRNPWDIFTMNDKVLRDDFKRLTSGKKSKSLSNTNKILGKENVFVEAGVKCECAIINANTGPVYIGRDVEIMEGSVIRGPLALSDHSTLKLSTKIYGATSIGPYCKVGGEINNSIFIGYSSKAHDGFLGNAVIGEWCNLGADTNNSNLKNNYARVKLWSYPEEHFIDTGLQFCGLIMGDHSKCGINTMFNTGTVVGVSVNIYGSGFPRNFIPSFTWGGPGGFTTYKPEKAFESARSAMNRRDVGLTKDDEAILLKVYELTEKYRKK